MSVNSNPYGRTYFPLDQTYVPAPVVLCATWVYADVCYNYHPKHSNGKANLSDSERLPNAPFSKSEPSYGGSLHGRVGCLGN